MHIVNWNLWTMLFIEPSRKYFSTLWLSCGQQYQLLEPGWRYGFVFGLYLNNVYIAQIHVLNFMMCTYRTKLINGQNSAKQFSGKRQRFKNSTIHAYVITKLKSGWSPEQIAGRLLIDRSGNNISHEAFIIIIYDRQNTQVTRFNTISWSFS